MKVRVKSLVCHIVEKSDGTPQPFIGLEDVASGTGRLVTDEVPQKEAGDSIVHRPGDVLFSKLRPYLAKSYLPERPGTATGELLVLRPSEQLDSRFLFYVTLSQPWINWANTTSYGSKMPRTSWEYLADYRVWLPPKEEQRRIADFLDAETAHIDQLIRFRSDQMQLLVEREKSMIDAAFASAHSGGLTRLKYLLASRPRYGVLVPEFVDDGVPFVRVNDIIGIRENQGVGSLRRIPGSLSAQYARTIVQSGDLLISVVGTLGQAVVAGEELAGANIARAVCSIRVQPGIEVDLLHAWISSSYFETQAVTATSTDTAQPTLGMEDLANFRIMWPQAAGERTEILKRVTAARHALNELKRRLQLQDRLLAERRQALITAAVTGQFDVSTASGRRVAE